MTPGGRRTGIRLLVGTVLVAAVIVATILVVLGTAGRRQADDPRSPTPTGAGALGQLLQDQGISAITTDRVDDAVRDAGPGSTLVVANADQLTEEAAGRLLAAGSSRTVLLRPNSLALRTFGVTAEGVTPDAGRLAPDCGQDSAVRAGPVLVEDPRAAYRPSGPSDFSCYPTGGGYAYLGARAENGSQIQLLAGGVSNAVLGQEGNAALAMNVLGSQPRLVWLMGARTEPRSVDPDDTPPRLLPNWWQIAVVQAFLALVVVGIWRGRRLGPILSERLPVRVRAAETVEGHGRLYYRLSARDQAARALRAGSRQRLVRSFGAAPSPSAADDELALSAAIGARTGRDPLQVRLTLFGPPPTTDDQLVALARDLDRLEQEARQL